MDPRTFFSNKAENYAKYRWDYAPQAIEAIFEIAQLTITSAVADIGAGTGILTRQFAGRVGQIYAVEPNVDMRTVAARQLAANRSIVVIDGSAEATKLPPNSIDVITVAQAIHWFEPEPAVQEMRRILKPEGWLALLRNVPTDEERNDALAEIVRDELGIGSGTVYPRSRKKPVDFYFDRSEYQRLTFPFQFRQNWQQFIGVLSTVSYMPLGDDPQFIKLKGAVKKHFDHYSQDGYLMVHGETELLIGRPA